jgi:hypothetical protein
VAFEGEVVKGNWGFVGGGESHLREERDMGVRTDEKGEALAEDLHREDITVLRA